MPLNSQITQSLAQWKGLDALQDPSAAVRATWEASGLLTVEAHLVAVDTLSCACQEIAARAPALETAPVTTLEAWVKELCARVTYLLEPLGPIEVDTISATVLARSVPPAREEGHTSFYEIVASHPGSLVLRRYARAHGSAEREPIPLHLTHEVLKRLARDLIASIPTAESE